MKEIEETLKHCRKCEMKTTHQRNTNKTGLVMLLVHLVLIAVTWGVWLIILAIWTLLNQRVGGWICSECGNRRFL